MKINTFFRVCFVIIITTTLLTACSGESPVVNESWALIDLISKGERTSVATEIVEVRNCETAERKATECSAGTNNDLTVSLEGGIQFVGGIVSMNTSVTNGLGIGHNSGESLTLDTPAEGSIYIYTIDKEYRLITGEMLVRSSAGRETEANYTFHASCSITVVNVETASCATGSFSSSSSQDTITVFANKSWQDTGINISRGDLVTIEYISGSWGKDHQDANGDSTGYTCSGAMPASQCTELVPEAVQGSLVGKIGKQILKIGNYIEFTSEQNGSLFLSRNYDTFGFPHNGDTGEIIVQVTVKRRQ